MATLTHLLGGLVSQLGRNLPKCFASGSSLLTGGQNGSVCFSETGTGFYCQQLYSDIILMFVWFGSDRVQMSFSPLVLITVCSTSSSSSSSFPVLRSWLSPLLLFSGGLWETEFLSVDLVCDEWDWRCWKKSQNSSCRLGWCTRRVEI